MGRICKILVIMVFGAMALISSSTVYATQPRMIYVPDKVSDDGVAKVVYTAKDKKSKKVFKFLTFRLCSGLAGQIGRSYSRPV